MRTLALDGGMGASGDMLLGALLAVGADRSVLAPVEDALSVRYGITETERNGIAATSVTVRTEGDDHDHDHGHGHENSHVHEDSHVHENSHVHDDSHDHDRDHSHDDGHPAEGHGPHRHYDEVVDVVEGMNLPESVEADALAIFEILGEAEAAVHGTDLHETHFHEVGADDAIADVVGALLLLSDLDVERVTTTPLSAGGGEVEMSHGVYPVPVPAVTEIAARADWEIRGGPVDAELLTPTGAAILAHVAEGVDRLPPVRIESSGYGAGSRSFADHPNVLRALVGEGRGGLERQPISVLETNLDDVTPEVLGDLQRSLLEAGARDVSVVPLTMKKARPGHLVRVICEPTDAERLARRLAAETGTLGVRETGAGHRWIAERRTATVAIGLGGGIGDPGAGGDETVEVAVKVATDEDGEVLDVSAEFEDARSVAAAADLPVREVVRRAEAAAHDAIDDGRLEL